METSSSSGSCIAGAVDDSFVVNTYSDANNKANFDIGNGSIILESKKKGYQAEVDFMAVAGLEECILERSHRPRRTPKRLC